MQNREVDAVKLPAGADHPMRVAIATAYEALTGESPEYIFSGWDGELTETEELVRDQDRRGGE